MYTQHVFHDIILHLFKFVCFRAMAYAAFVELHEQLCLYNICFLLIILIHSAVQVRFNHYSEIWPCCPYTLQCPPELPLSKVSSDWLRHVNSVGSKFSIS